MVWLPAGVIVVAFGGYFGMPPIRAGRASPRRHFSASRWRPSPAILRDHDSGQHFPGPSASRMRRKNGDASATGRSTTGPRA